MKYFKVTCEYDLGNETHPYVAYYSCESLDKLINVVFKDVDWIESGFTIDDYLNDLLHIEEVKISDIIWSIE